MLIVPQHLKDHLVLFFVLLTGKLYVIGMLRTLNSRAKLRERMKSHDLGRTSLGDFQWDRARGSDMTGDQSLLEVSLNIYLLETILNGLTDSFKPPKTFDASATLRLSSLCLTAQAQRSDEVAPDDVSNMFQSVTARIGETTEDLQLSSPYMDARERSVSFRRVSR